MRSLCLFVSVLLVLASCTDRGRLERRENRIEGRWYFDRAFYKDDAALFRDNLMGEYRGDEIAFYEGGYAEYYDRSLDEYLEGYWVLTLHKSTHHEEIDRIYTLDMEFYDHIARENFSFYSNATKIGFSNLNLEVYDDFGLYTFKLNKIN